MYKHDNRDSSEEVLFLPPHAISPIDVRHDKKQSDSNPSSIRKQSAISPLLKPIILFLLGGLLAVIHHFINTYADKRPLNSIVIPQVWMSRIGTGLAFGFKSALSVSVGFVLCQLMWLTLRRKFLTLPEIDNVYLTANQDVVASFFSSSILKSPLLVLMVAVSLLLPITTVFTPSSLRVVPYTPEPQIPCQIPTGNLTNGGSENDLYVAGGSGEALSWSGLTPLARELAYPTMVAQNIPPLPIPRQCDGLDCTYSVSFPSVVYQCKEGKKPPTGSNTQGPLITFWNATSSGVTAFNAVWTSYDASGTTGSVLCAAQKAQYDFTIQNSGGKQTVKYTVTQIGELKGNSPLNQTEPDRVYEFQLSSVANVIQSLLLGTISEMVSPGGTTTRLDSQAISAAFFKNTGYYTWGDVAGGIEQLSHNVSAAILTMNLGVKDSSCAVSGQGVSYKYDRLNLWLPYGVALFIVSLCLVLGIIVFLGVNPENLTSSFSDTVKITRNSPVDILAGSGNGVDSGKQKSGSPRFRLGELKNGKRGFGTREELA